MSSKKEMLLNVVENLFYYYGFYFIGLKWIIMDVDIVIMILYNYFDFKDDFIVEVFFCREQ